MSASYNQDLEDFVLITGSDTEEPHRLGEKPDVVASIKAWLEPTEYEADTSEFVKHRNAHVPGTGQWVLETNQYKRWSQTDEIGDLWIRGIPGSGKSVVASTLVQELRQRQDAPVLFFFFRQIILSNRSPKSFLQDCSVQLLDDSPLLQTTLKSIKKKFSHISEVPFDELYKAFSSALVAMDKVYCILDALDEMNLGEDVFLANLLDLGRRYPHSIKLALTSRQLPYLEAHFKGSCLVDLRLDRKNVDRDISKYISYRLANTEITQEDAKAIKITICEKGQGLFLYARLMMDECVRNPRGFLSQKLPDGLGNMYTDLLNEHARRSGVTRKFQQQILGWVTHSMRPLRLIEMTALLNSMPDREGLLQSQDTKKTLRSCCGPLLEVCEDETVQIIHHSFTEFLLGSQLSHVQISGGDRFPVLEPLKVHSRIAIACIKYLQSGIFQEFSIQKRCGTTKQEIYHGDCLSPSGYSADLDATRKLGLKFHFAQYAIKFWHTHAAIAGKDTELFEALDLFLVNESHDFESWKDVWSGLNTHTPINLTPMHISAHCGMTEYTEALLSRGEDGNVVDGFLRTPLMYAAMCDHPETASVLLKYNAEHSAIDKTGLVSLHHAAKLGCAAVMRVLLAVGAKPRIERTEGDLSFLSPTLIKDGQVLKSETPLYYVSISGHTKALEVLMGYIAPEDLQPEALFWAAEAGKPEIVETLLRNPWNVNNKDSNGNTALFYAARNRDPKMTRALVKAGADPNIMSEGRSREVDNRKYGTIGVGPRTGRQPRRYSAIHAWARISEVMYYQPMVGSAKDMLDVLEILISAGGDINLRDHQGQSAIFAWNSFLHFETGREESFVKWMLERGADATLLDHEGRSALHQMKGGTREKNAAKLLMNAGADINLAESLDGMTPLMNAAQRSQLMNPTLFHELGADFNLQDNYGNTAFHYACSSWCMEASHAEIWLSFANPLILNNARRFAMTNFAWGNGGGGRVGSISNMVQMGMNLETRDYLGRTVLLTFLCNDSVQGQEKFIKELLRLGANAKAVDFEGKSALHLLASCDLSWIGGDADIKLKSQLMSDLIAAGSDVNARDYLGNTILHDAIYWDTFWAKALVSVSAIINTGIDLRGRNHQGRTALHAAALKGFDDSNSGGSYLDFFLQPKLDFDINEEDNQGIRPIHLAAETSEIGVWKLFQAGAELDGKDIFGRNALHWAAAAGKVNVVCLLIELFKEDSYFLNTKDLKGRTALHEAARSGSADSVNSLLDAGADAQIRDKRGRTALHAAAEFEYVPPGRDSQRVHDKKWLVARKGRHAYSSNEERIEPGFDALQVTITEEKHVNRIRDVIKALIDAGVNPSVLDTNDHTALDVALSLGNSPVVQELRPLMQIIYKDTSNKLQPLDDFGENLLSVDGSVAFESGYCVGTSENRIRYLERVFSTGDERLIDRVIQKGLILIGSDGNSPIHLVVRWGMTTMMKKLLPHIVDINTFSPPLLITALERHSRNTEMIKLLLKAGCEVNAVRKLDDGNLNFSFVGKLSSGNDWWYAEALELALNAGGDPYVENSGSKTAVQVALSKIGYSRFLASDTAGFWSERTLDVLLNHGVQLNVASSDGMTPLNVALQSERGHVLVEKLIDYGADGAFGPIPAISSAIDCQDIVSLEMLLEAGSDPNVSYKSPEKKRYEEVHRIETPLFNAAAKCRRYEIRTKISNDESAKPSEPEDIIDLLLKFGADPLQPMEDGNSTVLHEVASLNGTFTPNFLKGIDLERKDSRGRTALHRACDLPERYRRSVETEQTAMMLLRHGADARAVDDEGFTALHYAVKCRLKTTIKYLLEKGASTTAINDLGVSPLFYAYGGDEDEHVFFQRDIVETLLDNGADPALCEPKGKTLLHRIVSRMMETSSIDGSDIKAEYGESRNPAELLSLKELYRRLTTLGCDPEARDNEGNTPMFDYVATCKPYNDMSGSNPTDPKDHKELFAKHDIFATNNKGDGLLHVVAAREENSYGPETEDVVLFQLLVELGLDPRMENKEGVTPLDVAAACDNQKILELYARDD